MDTFDLNTELIRCFIERSLLNALGRGHDKDISYHQKMLEQEEAIDFLFTPKFEMFCEYIGLDADNIRPRIFEQLGFTPEPAYQLEIEECV